jgi:hypothetical protein
VIDDLAAKPAESGQQNAARIASWPEEDRNGHAQAVGTKGLSSIGARLVNLRKPEAACHDCARGESLQRNAPTL